MHPHSAACTAHRLFNRFIGPTNRGDRHAMSRLEPSRPRQPIALPSVVRSETREVPMYHTRADFEADVFQCNPPYPDRALASIEVAWEVYQAAGQTNLNTLVLGRWVEPSAPGAPGIDRAMQANFHIMDEVFTGGSIMNSGNWTLLVNDAWVLGGVHSHTQFQLASPRNATNIWDAGNNRLTVTGRELVGLVSYGYAIRRLPLGEVAVCADPGLADAATFADYRLAIDRYTNNPDQNLPALVDLRALH